MFFNLTFVGAIIIVGIIIIVVVIIIVVIVLKMKKKKHLKDIFEYVTAPSIIEWGLRFFIS